MTTPTPETASPAPTRTERRLEGTVADGCRGWRGAMGWFALTAATMGVCAGWASAALFVVGELVSDTYSTTQWLAWIPIESAIVAVVGSLVCGAAGAGVLRVVCGTTRGGRRLLRSTIGSAALVVVFGWFFAFVEHRPLRAAPEIPDDAIRVLHWNPRWPGRREAPIVLERLSELLDENPADVVVLTQAGYLLLFGRAKRFTDEGWTVLEMRPFTIMTKLPILELRRLVLFRGRNVTLLRVDSSPAGVAADSTRHVPGELVLWLVDLPSDPQLPRKESLVEVRKELDKINAPDPDLLIGDLNNVRRSRALRALAPSLQNAFDLAGRGWSGTFPEWLPLWHIDHMLVGPEFDAIDYVTIPTHMSDHRAHWGVFRRVDPPTAR